jgi:hypothetical protein
MAFAPFTRLGLSGTMMPFIDFGGEAPATGGPFPHYIRRNNSLAGCMITLGA